MNDFSGNADAGAASQEPLQQGQQSALRPIGMLETAHVLSRNPDTTVQSVISPLSELRVVASFGTSCTDTSFKNREQTLRELLPALYTFERGQKDGKCFVLGEFSGPRSASNLVCNYGLCLDSDTGTSKRVVLEALARHGWFAVVYTTHSNGKAETDVPVKQFSDYARHQRKFTGHDADIPPAWAVDYLRDVKGYAPEVLEGAVPGKPVFKDGREFIPVKHQPMTKVRVVLPFARPFVFAERGAAGSALEEWKHAYDAVVEALGIPFDPKCNDAPRLSYLPRIPVDAVIGTGHHQAFIVDGTLLDLEPFCKLGRERAEAAKRSRSGRHKHTAGGKNHACDIPEEEVQEFLKVADDFRAGDAIEALAPDTVVKHVANESSGEGVDAECPTVELHTELKAGDRRFFARNADLDAGRPWIMRCHGTTCTAASNDDRAVYLVAFMQKHGLSIDDLLPFSAKAAAHFERKRAEEEAWQKAESLAANPDTLKAEIEAVTKETDTATVDTLITALGASSDNTKTAGLTKMLGENSVLGVTEAKRMVKGARKDHDEKKPKPSHRAAQKPKVPLHPELENWQMPHPDLAGGGEFFIATHCGAPFIHLQRDGDEFARPLFTPLAIIGRVKYVDDGDGVEGHRWKVHTSEGAEIIDLPASMALGGFGNELIAKFRDLGVRAEEEGQKLIKRMSMVAAADTSPILIVAKPGWHPNIGFMTPNGELFATTVDEPLKVELAEGNPLKDHARGGTLEGAKAVAEAVLNSGHEGMQMGLLAGPVACILQLAGMDGFTIFCGGETSKGKSTAQGIKASSWGTPALNKGLNRTAHGTANALENVLVYGHGCGAELDEVRGMAGSEVEATLFRVQGGQTRGRAQRSGDANRKTRGYTTCASMSGEIGVIQKIEAEGKSAAGGTAARVVAVDFSFAPRLPTAVMQQIEKYREHYGWAGPAVVEELIKQGYAAEPHRVVGDIGVYAQELAGKDASALELRAAKMYGAIWLSAKLLQDAGFISSAFDVEGLLRRQWEARADREDGKSVVERALEQLREHIIQAQIISRMDDTSGEVERGDPPTVDTWTLSDRRTGKLLAEVHKKDGIYCVPTITITDLVKGLDNKVVSAELARRDLLIKPGDPTRNTHKTLPSGLKISHLRIKAAFFREDGSTANREAGGTKHQAAAGKDAAIPDAYLAIWRGACLEDDGEPETTLQEDAELGAATEDAPPNRWLDLDGRFREDNPWLDAYNRMCREYRQGGRPGGLH